MYAIVGIPGSAHHTYKHFERSERADALAWLDKTYAQIRDRNPALGSLPTRVVSDREAATVRYQSGTRVYTWDNDATRDEERDVAYGAALPRDWWGRPIAEHAQ